MFFLHIFEFFFILVICFIIINSIYLPVSFSNLLSFLGFCFPENYFLFDVILLYVEIFNIGLIVLILLLNTLSVILDSFKSKPINVNILEPFVLPGYNSNEFLCKYYENHFPKAPVDYIGEDLSRLFINYESKENEDIIEKFKNFLYLNYPILYSIFNITFKFITLIKNLYNKFFNFSEKKIFTDNQLWGMFNIWIKNTSNDSLFKKAPFLKDWEFFKSIFPTEESLKQSYVSSEFFTNNSNDEVTKLYDSFFYFNDSSEYNIESDETIYNYTSLEFDPQTEEFFDFIFVLIPSIFILMILIPCVGYLYTSEFFFNWLLYDVKLDLIGYQWYWYYEFKIETLYSSNIYENNGYITKYCDFVTVFSQEEDNFKRNLDVDIMMVLPQNINVLISISSGDVIHSWTIPGYTTKFDAIPGRTYCFINVISEVGYNWGQCSELCGANHAFMPSSLDVTTDRYSFDLTLTKFYYKN